MHSCRPRCNVRKLLCGNALLAVALPLLIIGCGGSPTEPTTPSTQANVVSPTPAPTPAPGPTPAPADPTPAPDPGPIPPPPPSPAPAPSPTPEPTPAPAPTPSPTPTPTDSAVRYDAQVKTVSWYGPPLFTSEDIEIVRYKDRIVFGSMTLPIVFQDDRSVIARTPEMTFSAVDSTWSFNGLAGQGSGTWTKK
jgi:hypothetical protein